MKNISVATVEDFPSIGMFGEFVIPEIQGGFPIESPKDTRVFVFNSNGKLSLGRKHCEIFNKNIGFAGREQSSFRILIHEYIGEGGNFRVKAATKKKAPEISSLFGGLRKSSTVYFSF